LQYAESIERRGGREERKGKSLVHQRFYLLNKTLTTAGAVGRCCGAILYVSGIGER